MSLPLIADVVPNTPIPEKPSHQPSCPFCGSSDIVSKGVSTTLVGGGSSVDDDPNHTWNDCSCNKCSRTFVRETSHGKVWYTSGGAVIRGFPNCFEAYRYDCPQCKSLGTVERRYTLLDGVTKASALQTNVSEDGDYDVVTKQYRCFFRCSQCRHDVEVGEEFPGCSLAPSRRKKIGPLNWVVREEIGTISINTKFSAGSQIERIASGLAHKSPAMGKTTGIPRLQA